MGEGAEIVVMDEGALISDDTEATIYRMGAGQGDRFCYIKIGNPWTRGHFYLSSKDPRYHKINIDYIQALAEGRYTADFIEEARTKPLFDVLYENKFPKENIIDSRGYRKLMTATEVDNCQEELSSEIIESELNKYKNNVKIENKEDREECLFKGRPKLGGDIGRGGNLSVYVLRFDNYAIIIEKNQIKDLMQQVPIIQRIVADYGIDPSDVAIDDTGVGGGVTDRLTELGCEVNGVKTGSAPFDNDYLNIRAENMFLMRDWLVNAEGKIITDVTWTKQLNIIRYKENSSSKLQMESKDDLKKRAKEEGVDIDSPDEADALALTFSNAPITRASDFAIV
jgi:hypothetical protein